MTSSPNSKWVLSVPFRTAPPFALTDERVLSLGGLQAELLPAPAGQTRILVNGIESERAARELFDSLLLGMLAGSLNISWGIRVRNEVRVLSMDSALPDEVDLPLIYPEGKDFRRLLIVPGTPQIQFDKILPTLLASLEFGLTSTSGRTAMTDDRVRLAVELYIDSYFEVSESARFLGLVGVLEVLKDKNKSSDAAQSLVNEWIRQARTLDPEEAVSVQGTLRYLRQISISRGITSVVRRHLGDDSATEAQYLYTVRSKLVHDGLRPPDPADTARRARQIVMSLLGHILTVGTL